MDEGELRSRADDLPKKPGVYQFESDERVLYIGKAVDLRSRIRSYLDPRSDRIARMVGRAQDVEVAVTGSETQAVLLEANLIKKHQPRYNVRLTDDKSYPVVQITSHSAPRIEITRAPDGDATVYGPFTSKSTLEKVVKALREIYGIRGCSDHKFANRDRPCQDHEIGLCSAPCTGEISTDEYSRDVERVKEFLEGATGILTDPLEVEMEQAAERREFERAANLRDRLYAAETLHQGGGDAVINAEEDPVTVDVLGTTVEGDQATVARLRSEGGKLNDRSRHKLEAPATTEAGSVLSAFIPQFYSARDLPDTLLLSDRINDTEVKSWLEDQGVDVEIPGTGRYGRLVDLALQNSRRGFTTKEETTELADRLGLSNVSRIEGFDVSHSQGKDAVGSDVVFIGGNPEKSHYRRKRLTDENDDYENMRRLITWRATRALEGRDDRPDPDLLLIDGGQGQLDAAQEALDSTGWEIPVVALAKDEEILYTSNQIFDWESSAPQLHLLQRIRDEAHRFAVQYHQTVRDDIETILSQVPGIGDELGKRLLRRFGSVKGIREASTEELTDVDGVGTQTAKKLGTRL